MPNNSNGVAGDIALLPDVKTKAVLGSVGSRPTKPPTVEGGKPAESVAQQQDRPSNNTEKSHLRSFRKWIRNATHRGIDAEQARKHVHSAGNSKPTGDRTITFKRRTVKLQDAVISEAIETNITYEAWSIIKNDKSDDTEVWFTIALYLSVEEIQAIVEQFRRKNKSIWEQYWKLNKTQQDLIEKKCSEGRNKQNTGALDMSIAALKVYPKRARGPDIDVVQFVLRYNHTAKVNPDNSHPRLSDGASQLVQNRLADLGSGVTSFNAYLPHLPLMPLPLQSKVQEANQTQFDSLYDAVLTQVRNELRQDPNRAMQDQKKLPESNGNAHGVSTIVKLENKHTIVDPVLSRGAGTSARRIPTFPKINRKYIEFETLKHYNIPWEFDLTNPQYVVILQELSVPETNVLFKHTQRLRKRHPATGLGIEERKHNDFEMVFRRERSRARRDGKHSKKLDRDEDLVVAKQSWPIRNSPPLRTHSSVSDGDHNRDDVEAAQESAFKPSADNADVDVDDNVPERIFEKRNPSLDGLTPQWPYDIPEDLSTGEVDPVDPDAQDIETGITRITIARTSSPRGPRRRSRVSDTFRPSMVNHEIAVDVESGHSTDSDAEELVTVVPVRDMQPSKARYSRKAVASRSVRQSSAGQAPPVSYTSVGLGSEDSYNETSSDEEAT